MTMTEQPAAARYDWRHGVSVEMPDGVWRVGLGPVDPGRCQRYGCARGIGDHHHRRYGIEHLFDGGPANPGEWNIVPALCHTEWTCPKCGEDNDVWGEGVINGWFECGSCFVEMFLALDAYLTTEAPK